MQLTKNQISDDQKFDPAPQIRRAAALAMTAAEDAVHKAILCGHLLCEQKDRMPHGSWLPWLEKNCPDIKTDRAARWMKAAQESLRALGDAAITLPASKLLTLPDAELDDDALEARQLLLDFSEGKTIKECMAGVIVEGDDGTRLTRAANGKLKGGHNGEDRKDWPEFIRRKLKAVTEHLSHWKSFKGAQGEQTLVHFAAAIETWPLPLLESMEKHIKAEIKRR